MKVSKIKVLFLVQLPPPVHGASLMNHYAIENPLWDESYSVKVLPLYFGQTLENIGRISIRKVGIMFIFFFRMIYILLSFQPRIVYFTIMPTGRTFYRDALLALIIKCFGRKIIFHLHGIGIKEESSSSYFKRQIYKIIFWNTNVICMSENLKADVKSIYKGNPFVLANGIEDHELHLIKEDIDPPVILYLSNLVKNKGIMVLLQSFEQLNNENISFRAKIIGGPADVSMEDIQDFCNAKGLADKVFVLGPKYNQEKVIELMKADIFVLPSFNECFPVSILEAMQVGLPIVATTVGGIPDIIKDKQEGLLVESNNFYDLSQKLKLLLIDKQLRTVLGANARDKFCSNYTVDKFHSGLAKIFEQVANV